MQTAALAVLVSLALLTRHQITFWKDDITVWTHSIDVNGRNWSAETMIGGILEDRHRDDEALQHLYRAAEDAPNNYFVNFLIGNAEYSRHNLPQAIRHYQKALAVSNTGTKQDEVRLWANLANAYREMGDPLHAGECFEHSIKIQSELNAPPPKLAVDEPVAWWQKIGSYLRRILPPQ